MTLWTHCIHMYICLHDRGQIICLHYLLFTLSHYLLKSGQQFPIGSLQIQFVLAERECENIQALKKKVHHVVVKIIQSNTRQVFINVFIHFIYGVSQTTCPLLVNHWLITVDRETETPYNRPVNFRNPLVLNLII